VDDASKTRGFKHFNVKTSLWFAPPYKNVWLRACIQYAVCIIGYMVVGTMFPGGSIVVKSSFDQLETKRKTFFY